MNDMIRPPGPALWALAPVALAQGLWLRRTALRLPEAGGRSGLAGEGLTALRVLVVGDSVAAGVGLDHHEQSMAGVLARRLATAYSRPVAWEVIARSGATAGEVAGMLTGRQELATADIVLVSIGVNDTKNLHPVDRWRRELGALLDVVLTEAPYAEVLMLGIPPMEVLPALRRPLAAFLGARSRVLDRVGEEVARERPRVRRIVGELVVEDGFARDGFHPSAALHGRFVEAALALLPEERFSR